MNATWGIHPLRPSLDFLAEDLIVLERPGVGDLRKIGDDRDALNALLQARYPRKTEDTIRRWAGTLLRFAFAAQPGDLIVHPDAARRTLSFGRLVGDYFWRDGHPADQHCRKVQWRRTGIARERFTAEAQKAVEGRAAFFGIGEAGPEFEAYVAASRGRR
ncbi:MAG: restriction system protein [Solirubrobacteraceae bacterium]|jgi:predicted Mrr-cat superfamily restriction endonuclease|nr:restriction system protein [Solirubrobacteraceae bacterium]MEA2288361.1 restriction system protein [Solirubrobacteraceae bacterium]